MSGLLVRDFVMNARWIGPGIVVAAVVVIIVYKAIPASLENAASETLPEVAPEGASEVAAREPSVVLVADPSEAESSCGCGEIIRTVRASRERGVGVVEIEPGSPRARQYQALVNPTVLFLGSDGSVQARLEGEESSTIETLKAKLDELSAKGR